MASPSAMPTVRTPGVYRDDTGAAGSVDGGRAGGGDAGAAFACFAGAVGAVGAGHALGEVRAGVVAGDAHGHARCVGLAGVRGALDAPGARGAELLEWLAGDVAEEARRGVGVPAADLEVEA